MAHAQGQCKGANADEGSDGTFLSRFCDIESKYLREAVVKEDLATMLRTITGEVFNSPSSKGDIEETIEERLLGEFPKKKSADTFIRIDAKGKADADFSEQYSKGDFTIALRPKNSKREVETCHLEDISKGEPGIALNPQDAIENVDNSLQPLSVKALIASGVRDPLMILPKDVVFEVFSYLSPTELVLFRAFSRKWQTALDAYATNSALQQHFETMGIAPQWQDTREQANLRFRREVFYHESLKAGQAVKLNEILHTEYWHVNGDYLVIASGDGHVALVECVPGTNMQMLWKLHCVDLSAVFPGSFLATIKSVLGDVYVTTSGYVLVDTKPNRTHFTHGGAYLLSTMYSEKGEKLWSQELETFAGRAYIKDDKIFRIECGDTELNACITWFIVRSVHTGHIVGKKQIVIRSPLDQKWFPLQWSLMLYGFMDLAILVPISRPITEVLLIDLESGGTLGHYRYESLGWHLMSRQQPRLTHPVAFVLDQASPKSPGFQPGYFDIESEMTAWYLDPQASLTYPLTTTQHLMWFDDKAAYIKDVFFQLEGGIVKIKLNEGCEVALRDTEENLHYTLNSPYTCITVPAEGNGREVIVVDAGTERNFYTYLGMAGKFLAVHETTNFRLFLFDFRAPW